MELELVAPATSRVPVSSMSSWSKSWLSCTRRTQPCSSLPALWPMTPLSSPWPRSCQVSPDTRSSWGLAPPAPCRLRAGLWMGEGHLSSLMPVAALARGPPPPCFTPPPASSLRSPPSSLPHDFLRTQGPCFSRVAPSGEALDAESAGNTSVPPGPAECSS